MKYFFCGNVLQEGGVPNVNRTYIKVLPSCFVYLKSKNKYLSVFESIYKIIIADKVVFSGIGRLWGILLFLCSLLNKKYVYIMHGWLEYEDSINKSINELGEKNENRLLVGSSKILCVSKNFSCFVKRRVSAEISKKIDYITNPIDFSSLEQLMIKNPKRDLKQIILIGGGRVTKRNLQVCMAVDYLNRQYDTNFHVKLFGPPAGGDDLEKMLQYKFVKYFGSVDHKLLIEEMQKSSLFVQCSDIESFSLGVLEALLCGCSILVSQYVGAIGILSSIDETAIINDPTNIKEIANKMYAIMMVSNNAKICGSIDKEEVSNIYAANKLKKFMDNI